MMLQPTLSYVTSIVLTALLKVQVFKKNADGSVDIYFGPKAPEGKEANWVPTNPDGTFELMARFYGPEKTFYTKTWKLSDVEKVK
ncbi:MAG TPA: DUF1214 domain-containing protein [Chryseolinea sp.]|nr:DUF1214 domain-containing protein [Chryseolinea sp.]